MQSLLTLRQTPRLALLASLVALVLIMPLSAVLTVGVSGSVEIWQHLWQTVLSDYLYNSFVLMLGVTCGVLLLGVPAAWLTACCDFPLRRLCSLLLLLPLAMPAYIMAYTYTGLLDFAGPVQSWLRDLTGWRYGEYWFVEIRSLGGAIAMLSLVLYPYVYLLTRAALLGQPEQLQQASRSLGQTPWQTLIRVTLPLARPAIVAGVTLALMETLADYGTVEYFGVATFTTGMFRTYYGLGDIAAACQLALVLLGFILLLLGLEKYSRRQVRYFSGAEQGRSLKRVQLTSNWRWVALLFCCVPVLLGFLLPSALLLGWSLESTEWQHAQFITLANHSLLLAAGAAILITLLAVFLAYSRRLKPSVVLLGPVYLSALGYALPGTMVAMGVLICLTWLDHHWVVWLEQQFQLELGLLFSGSLFALVLAYSVRFLTIAMGPVQTGLAALKPSLDASARLLGRTPFQVLKELHLPLLKGSLLTAILIVFVEIMKELPATLMLRPFNFNTLAVRAYELASDERLVDAAPASLMIVLVGLLPVLLLNQTSMKRGDDA